MVETEAVASIRRYLSVLIGEGVPVLFGVMYGSQANGNFGQWSDIDLLVVSPHFDQEHSREEWANLWYIANQVDPRIEPIPCGEIEWRENDFSPILEIARREGIIVEVGQPDTAPVTVPAQKEG